MRNKIPTFPLSILRKAFLPSSPISCWLKPSTFSDAQNHVGGGISRWSEFPSPWRLLHSSMAQWKWSWYKGAVWVWCHDVCPRPTPKAYSFILLCTDVKAPAPPTLPLQSLLAPLQAPTWIASRTHSDLPEVYPMQRSDAVILWKQRSLPLIGLSPQSFQHTQNTSESLLRLPGISCVSWLLVTSSRCTPIPPFGCCVCHLALAWAHGTLPPQGLCTHPSLSLHPSDPLPHFTRVSAQMTWLQRGPLGLPTLIPLSFVNNTYHSLTYYVFVCLFVILPLSHQNVSSRKTRRWVCSWLHFEGLWKHPSPVRCLWNICSMIA